MSWHELTYLPENLLWAWRKVRRAYHATDALFHWADVAQFELCLEKELAQIERELRVGTYRMSPIILVPQPKKPSSDGKPRLRQYFQIAVRDQVAWMAIANAIGPALDRMMPAWSYGNRLYRAAWYDDPPTDDINSKLNLGPYRHAGGHLYRHFKHSWPLYRRHIALTARRMANAQIDEAELDLGDRLAFGQIEGLQYLQHNYWLSRGTTLYTASLDLKKFYPSIKLDALRRGLAQLPGFQEDGAMRSLVDSMLQFRVDFDGLSADMQAVVDPQVTSRALDGLPTGLFVSGLLANIAMLPIDRAVSQLLTERRNLAHFRFVDDHEVLSYDPDDLISWIKEYNGLLKTHGLGAEIEQDKYHPPELKLLVHEEPSDAGATERTAVFEKFKAASQIDGTKPTSLMTRTLAQVSMLAATNFDLLTDAGRAQRLDQLEWLLLANIPDQEIRADTRAAFAATRIALLTPGLFRVDDEHLLAIRRLTELRLRQKATPQEVDEIDVLERLIPNLTAIENKKWHSTLQKYFNLLLEAFQSHPDKVRLYIKLFDYCRVTGFNGFKPIHAWMRAQTAATAPLKCYLGSMAVHITARHVITAVRDVSNLDLTHRDRKAARDFLDYVTQADWHSCIPLSGRSAPLECFQKDALEALVAVTLLGSLELELVDPQLSHKLKALGSSIPLETIDHSLETLGAATGRPFGIWLHWYLSTGGMHRYTTPPYWNAVAAILNPQIPEDWNSLRRYPSALPQSAWQHLYLSKGAELKRDDAGWLLDAARANREAFAQVSGPSVVTKPVAAKLIPQKSDVSLLEWAAYLKTCSPNDPRRSEWTALQIIKSILRSLETVDGPDLSVLDALHPANIYLPKSWQDLPPDAFIAGRISWEAWRREATNGKVKFSKLKIQDYRYTEVLETASISWPRRMRGIGQVLWGLIRQSFDLPNVWNIRGEERSLVDLVANELERLPISSHTLSILRACIMPRNRETAIMALHPSLFGKSDDVPDDTEFDWPIDSPVALVEVMERAQQILLRTQMTILEHEPRQLIPVSLQQLGSIAAADIEPDEVD